MRGKLASLAVLTLVAIATSPAATLYRWVDRDGVVHYSDRPQPGATQVELQSAQTFSAQQPAAATPRQTSNRAQPAAVPYDNLDLWKPQENEVYTNSANRIDVRLRLEPELQAGHAIWLYLDGKRVDGLPTSGEEFTVDNVWRGTHTLYAIVADRSGAPVARSQSVNFTMQQASLLSPGRARQTAPAPAPAPAPAGPRSN